SVFSALQRAPRLKPGNPLGPPRAADRTRDVAGHRARRADRGRTRFAVGGRARPTRDRRLRGRGGVGLLGTQALLQRQAPTLVVRTRTVLLHRARRRGGGRPHAARPAGGLRAGLVGATLGRLRPGLRTPGAARDAGALLAQPVQVPPGRALARAVVAGIVVFRRRRAMAFRAAAAGGGRRPHRRAVRRVVVRVGGIAVGRVTPAVVVMHPQRDARGVAVIGVAVTVLVVVVLGDRRTAVIVATVAGAHVVVGRATGQRQGAGQSAQHPQFHGPPPVRYAGSFGAAL